MDKIAVQDLSNRFGPPWACPGSRAREGENVHSLVLATYTVLLLAGALRWSVSRGFT
jgi:hypothetical protein